MHQQNTFWAKHNAFQITFLINILNRMVILSICEKVFLGDIYCNKICTWLIKYDKGMVHFMQLKPLGQDKEHSIVSVKH